MTCLDKQEMGYFPVNNAQVHFNNTPQCHLRNCSLIRRRETKMFSNFTWLHSIVAGDGKKKRNHYRLLS